MIFAGDLPRLNNLTTNLMFMPRSSKVIDPIDSVVSESHGRSVRLKC